MYLCPTRQLVNQVALQAENNYGLKVASFTGSSRDYNAKDKADYLSSDAVAITTYSSLFNTNPYFDNAQLIILDDAHSSENYIGSVWSLDIQRGSDERLYLGLLDIFKECFPSFTYERLLSGSFNYSDLGWVEKIPSPILFEKIPDVVSFIEANISESSQKYPWKFLHNKLHACNVFFGHDSILIRPYIPPAMSHSPFSKANQRIYMSATLGVGGDLERITGVEKISRISIPDGWDKQGIGRRFFMFPELSLPEEKIQDFCMEMIKSAGRALLLVPSESIANTYREAVSSKIKFVIFGARDIEQSKEKFVNKKMLLLY